MTANHDIDLVQFQTEPIKNNKDIMKYILLIPGLIFLLLFVLWPIAEIIILSTQSTNFIISKFVGIHNYIKIFNNPAFVTSIKNSFFYALLLAPLTTIASVLISFYVMNMSKKWHDLTRIIFYIPVLSAGVIISQIWKWVFYIDGPLNYFISFFGINKIAWFSKSATGICAIAFIVFISSIGGSLLIVLSSICSVDKKLYEAATIDGATWMQIKLKIILPLIMPMVELIFLMAVIASPQIYETVYLLAPYEHTATIAWSIYVEAFQMSHYGRASAMGIILMIILMIITVIKNKLETSK